jgi:hypothetical protein
MITLYYIVLGKNRAICGKAARIMIQMTIATRNGTVLQNILPRGILSYNIPPK